MDDFAAGQFSALCILLSILLILGGVYEVADNNHVKKEYVEHKEAWDNDYTFYVNKVKVTF